METQSHLKSLSLHSKTIYFSCCVTVLCSGKKYRRVLLNIRIPLGRTMSNVTFSEQRLRKGTRKVAEKSGGQEELFLQSRDLIRIQHRHPEAKLRWIFLCFLPCLWHKKCRFPAGNRRWTRPPAVGRSISHRRSQGFCLFFSKLGT